MTESAYCKNERATGIAPKALSNLVKLEAHQMWGKSITEPHHLVNPPSTDCFNACVARNKQYRPMLTVESWDISGPRSSARSKAVCNQRRINVDRVSISGGQGSVKQVCSLIFAKTHPLITSNADSYSRCFNQLDRILSLNKAKQASSGASLDVPCPVGVCRIDWAAQLTQTRHGVSVNKYQADSQSFAMNHDRLVVAVTSPALSTPLVAIWQKSGIGPIAVCKSSPLKGMSRGREAYPNDARRKHQNPACRGEGLQL